MEGHQIRCADQPSNPENFRKKAALYLKCSPTTKTAPVSFTLLFAATETKPPKVNLESSESTALYPTALPTEEPA
mgnify:CR=1 FL=1